MSRNLEQDIPSWYNLSANSEGIGIGINKKVVPQLANQLPTLSSGYRDRLDLESDFTPMSSDKEWGFGAVLSEVDAEGEWIQLECGFPTYINGRPNWARLFETSATLEVLFKNLKSFEDVTSAQTPQMMEIDLNTTKDRIYGGSIWASIRPALVRWINNNIGSKEEERKIRDAMKQANRKMFKSIFDDDNDEEFDDFGFSAKLRDPKWINLSCPGNATGMDPSNYTEKKIETGYTLIPHNTDSPLQQLTLLAGLAKMDSLARESLKSTE